MRILFITNLFPPHYIGGYEVACFDTFHILQNAGHECIVLTSKYDSGRLLVEDESQVHRVLETEKTFTLLKGKLGIPETRMHNRIEVEKTLVNFKPDIVYIWNLDGLTLSPAKVTKIHKIPMTVHLMDNGLLKYQWSFQRMLAKSLKYKDLELGRLDEIFNFAIAISHFTAKKLTKIGSIQKDVIYPFLDFSKPYSKKEQYKVGDIFRAVYLGQIETHKGVQEICDVIRRVNELGGKKISLDIYGRSSCGLDIEIEKTYGENVSIHRNLNRSEILKLLPDYDFGFFPSVWDEPFGIAQIEMMRAGLPVISSAKGGSREVLNNENSIIFDITDKNDLMQKLVVLLDNYSVLAEVIGKNASKTIESRFNEGLYLNALMEHFNSVLQYSGE